MKIGAGWLLLGLLLGCGSPAPKEAAAWQAWAFTKLDSVNPCLGPGEGRFFCPVRQDTVAWEVKDVFNPAVVVREGAVWMLYRAEDSVGRHAGTSRLGLARSEDGMHFVREAAPVFYPDQDSMQRYEWEGGVEDPRVVETEDGDYLMTYTAYDGQTARLCVARSPDLRRWTKLGLAFPAPAYRDLWSKSGAIVSRQEGDRIIATRIEGRYWMYWGDKQLHLAHSEDLDDWTIVTDRSGAPAVIMSYRPGKFDSDLVEPGPPALIEAGGIRLIYNGRNYGPQRNPDLAEGTYSAGQAIFALDDPGKLRWRSDTAFFRPEKNYEVEGQVNLVVFVQGLVPFQGNLWLYYGTADSHIAVAKQNS